MTHIGPNHRRGLSICDVHVWTARLNRHDRATTNLTRILDRDEQARAARLSFDRDRLRFVHAHGMMRHILARYCNADPAALTFARNPQGKPYLSSSSRANGAGDLQFSISHSGDYCVLALRLGRAIGIDVEKVRDLPQALGIAKSYFTPAESKALLVLRGAVRQHAFFVWWAHKEAAIKAQGLSLAAQLGRAEFAFDSTGGLQLVAWDGDRSVPQKWFIRRFDPAPGYVGAVAGMHPIRSLTIRTWDSSSSR
jgi:4'-phosphopantetheinyl transferase